MSADAVAVILGAFGTAAGVFVGRYFRARSAARRTDTQTELEAEERRAELAAVTETRVVAALNSHLDRVTADREYLRKMYDELRDDYAQLRRECDQRDRESRAEIDDLRGKYERVMGYLKYVTGVLRSRRIAVEPFDGAEDSDTHTHTPLPPDKPAGGA